MSFIDEKESSIILLQRQFKAYENKNNKIEDQFYLNHHQLADHKDVKSFLFIFIIVFLTRLLNFMVFDSTFYEQN